MGRTIDLGKIMISFGGEWAPGKQFEFLTVVRKGNDSFIARKDNIDVEPGTNVDIWWPIANVQAVIDYVQALGVSLDGAEAERIRKESERINAELLRKNAESVRVNAENARISRENARITAENARIAAEAQRSSAETSRVNAEATRSDAEQNRISNEQERVAHENERVSKFNQHWEALFRFYHDALAGRDELREYIDSITPLWVEVGADPFDWIKEEYEKRDSELLLGYGDAVYLGQYDPQTDEFKFYYISGSGGGWACTEETGWVQFRSPSTPRRFRAHINPLELDTEDAASTAAVYEYVQSVIQGFITNAVNDLENYYLKSETYTKAEVNSIVDALNQFSYVVASSLPTASAETMYKIYLTPSANPDTQNVRDEFITIRSGSEGSYTYAWEQIGSTAIDLSGEIQSGTTSANPLVNKSYVDNRFADKSVVINLGDPGYLRIDNRNADDILYQIIAGSSDPLAFVTSDKVIVIDGDIHGAKEKDGYIYLNFGGDIDCSVFAIRGSIDKVSTVGSIPAQATDIEISQLYTKPSSGIPSEDMSSAVQTSLGKADRAVSFDEQSLDSTEKLQARTNIGAVNAGDVQDIVNGRVSPIEAVIPSSTTTSNKLTNEGQVNSKIQSSEADFCGNWSTWDSVPEAERDYEYPDERTPDKNDYMVVRDASGYAPLFEHWVTWPGFLVGDIVRYFDEDDGEYYLYRCIQAYNAEVIEADPTDTEYWEKVASNPQYEGTWRFKYRANGSFDKNNWLPEYQVNEKPLTFEQLAALNSGINSQKVGKLDSLPSKPVDTAAQTLSNAEKLQARTNIGATAPEVFIATYGSTSFNDVYQAYQDGKMVFAKRGTGFYTLYSINTGSAYFSFTDDEQVRVVRLLSTNAWSEIAAYNQEKQSNKVSSWQATPDNNHYPAEKLVYDSMFVKGVISQTQTWTQAADGGYDYTMSNPVYGNIPKANIDLFEAAGATFNAVTGYFELNGLTDISYEEMGAIYSASLPFVERGELSISFVASNIRTNFTIHNAPSYDDLPGNVSLGAHALNGCGYSSVMEMFSYTTAEENFNYLNYFAVSGMARFMQGNRYIKTIVGTLVVASVTSFTYAFDRCFSLESVKLCKLKVSIGLQSSSRLSVASILYMINNEAATSAITITLHATAYARAMADADVVAALTVHTNIQLASA